MSAHGADSRQLAVLGFHKIGEPSPGAWETWYYNSVPELTGFLRHLRDQAWQVVDLETVLRGIDDPAALPDRAALITFDDAYRSVLLQALPVLREFGFPAVMFVPTDYVGLGSHSFDANSSEPDEPLCTWDELRALAAGGFSIQSHSASHPTFSEMTSGQQEVEIVRSKDLIEAEIGAPVRAFCFPYGDAGAAPHELWPLLERAGYQAAFLYDGALNSVPLRERFAISRLALGRGADIAGELAGIGTPY
ncbi:MAG: hypothetical protein QOE70_1060 [Chthoniobacter sp.]|jgi:peptidoglycan/xylan/chitin deacetylase (PgdA/CDA1 family)|nr:hypothetical protein [Chthoniobacter sp.]